MVLNVSPGRIMSQMRFNPITLDWVVMTPGRGQRPDDYPRESSARGPRVQTRKDCPFCEGNDHLVPREICRSENDSGMWQVRVVPNKFSAFVEGTDLRRTVSGTFRSMVAVGAHEVVIEHPRHDISLEQVSPQHLAEILRVYRSRYRELRQVPGVESIVIFKNHGERAGTSLEHPHSQITAAPVLSSQVCMRLQEARRFHEMNGACLYCQVLREELEEEDRVVEATPSFVAFVPYAALLPYHQWIFPRRHEASFDAITDAEILDLASLLSRQLQRLDRAAGAPDYNFLIRSGPVSGTSASCFHWYFSIMPRLNQMAGFELGSGTFLNTALPELCAERLRAAEVSCRD